MTGHRRATAAVLVCAVLAAGCLGFLTGSGPMTFAANETVVSDAALRETGYQRASNRTFTRTVNATVAGQTRRVRLTSHRVTYNRTVDLAAVTSAVANATADGANVTADRAEVPAAGAVRFVVLTTPSPTVAGQSVNPLAGRSTRQLVRRFLGRDSAEVRFTGNRTVRSLGARRTVSTYRVETRGGNATDLRVHVAAFDTGSDFVVAAAVHPAVIDERARVDALIAGLTQRGARSGSS